jgi:hypothetical protein
MLLFQGSTWSCKTATHNNDDGSCVSLLQNVVFSAHARFWSGIVAVFFSEEGEEKGERLSFCAKHAWRK